MSRPLAEGMETLIDACNRFYAKGWMVGTSGNLSLRVDDPARPEAAFLITSSGIDKGRVTGDRLLLLDKDGVPLGAAIPNNQDKPLKPSAETSIHLAVYEALPTADTVYHVHAPHATWLSMQAGWNEHRRIAGFAADTRSNPPTSSGEDGEPPLRTVTYSGGPDGFEMIKGFNLWSADDVAEIPVFRNHQEVPLIARDLGAYLRERKPKTPAMLIQGHGLTVWGDSAFAALRHAEILEYLAQQTWLAQGQRR